MAVAMGEVGPDGSAAKFDWGDAVTVRSTAPVHAHPGAEASVYSVEWFTGGTRSLDLNAALPCWVYGIEFEDGTSCEVAEEHLH